ncbi:TonB-dependent receptor [Acetobacter sp. AN02]|nr:TonB-dependent receptor [Acetobacter sp. AN02]MDG6093640.1 TonB-dependent receptor [Acetobacter sp. AN02]
MTRYERQYAATTPTSCSNAVAAGATVSCASQFFSGGNPALPYGAGGGVGYDQKGWGVQNILMGRAQFRTWTISHDIKAGVDVNYVDDNRYYGSWTGRVNNQSMRSPQYYYPGVNLSFPRSGLRNSTARDVGLFFSDRIRLTKQITLFGTARWDSFETTYNSEAVTTGRQTSQADRWSPSGSIVYAPLENGSFYFTFSRSYKPVGTDITSAVTNNAGSADVASNDKSLRPQRSDLYEFGTKWDFLHKRLGTTLAFFQINENNSQYYDANGDLALGFGDSGSGRRIRGVELSLTGKITKNWDIYGGYSYLDGKVTHSATAHGNQAPIVSHNNFSVWSSYDLSPLVLNQGWASLKVGGGAQYASGYWAAPSLVPTYRMPYNFTLNGMVSWEVRHYRVSFNGNNITDRVNYGSSFNGRTVPSAGRTFLGNVGVTF